MCLAFIKKFLSKKEEVVAEKVELGNLMDFLKSRNASEISDIEKEASRYKETISSGFVQLRSLLDEMRQLKSNDPFSRASTEVKNNFCDRAMVIISKGPRTDMGAHEFMESSHRVINEINSITPRQAAHMQFFFRENLDEVARKMKSILSHVDEFSEYMNTNIISDIEKIQKEMSAIKENEKKMLYFQKNMGEIESEIKDLQAKEQKAGTRAPEPDENVLNRMKSEMASLSREKQALFQEIETEFSGMEKLLKKYSHDTADKKSRALVEKYIESPAESFFIFDKDLQIRKVLAAIKNMVEKKEMDAEEKKYVHLCSVMNNMDHFRELRKKYQSVMKKICDKESELVQEERLYEKSRKVHDEVAEIRSRISELVLMKKQLEDSRSRMHEINEKHVKEIEFLVSSGTGLNIKISY